MHKTRLFFLLTLVLAGLPAAAQDAPRTDEASPRFDLGALADAADRRLVGPRDFRPGGRDPGAWRGPALVWPNPAFPTLQRAIDFAPDGTTIRILAGVHDIPAPLVVSGKRIRILGAGSGQERGRLRGITHLRGPRPRGIADPLRARGVVHYEDGGGILAHLKITGLAGITAGGTGVSASGLIADDVAVADCDYGAVWNAPGRLIVTGSTFAKVAFVGLYALNGHLSMFGVNVQDVDDIGIFIDTPGDCSGEDQNLLFQSNVSGCKGAGVIVFTGGACMVDCSIFGCRQGGIWIIQSVALIQDCHLLHNWVVGIGVIDSGVVIEDSRIRNTKPHIVTGLYGDGIAIVAGLFPSLVWVTNNTIEDSARAGLSNWGSEVALFGNAITCSAFELQGESYNGEHHNGYPFVFYDNGGNSCGCPDAVNPCTATSAGLEPPAPTLP